MSRCKLSFVGLIILLLAAGCSDSRPTRSECIIGFRLDWSKVAADQHAIRNSLGLRPIGDQRIVALSGMAITPDGKELYLQFNRDCDEKAGMAAALIAFWRSEGLDLPVFNRLAEPIVPSTRTMDLKGPDWRDDPP
jgi:hypothetical protein